MVEEASRRTPLGGCRDPGVAVAVAVAVAIILTTAMAVADGNDHRLGLCRGRGFGRDCV